MSNDCFDYSTTNQGQFMTQVGGTQVEKVWECKIVGDVPGGLPRGADAPMRDAVFAAFREVTGGANVKACFSGWGGKVNGLERSVIENRVPTVDESKDIAEHIVDELKGRKGMWPDDLDEETEAEVIDALRRIVVMGGA